MATYDNGKWYGCREFSREAWDEFKRILDEENAEHGCWDFTTVDDFIILMVNTDSLTLVDVLIKYSFIHNTLYLDRQYADNEIEGGDIDNNRYRDFLIRIRDWEETDEAYKN